MDNYVNYYEQQLPIDNGFLFRTRIRYNHIDGILELKRKFKLRSSYEDVYNCIKIIIDSIMVYNLFTKITITIEPCNNDRELLQDVLNQYSRDFNFNYPNFISKNNKLKITLL